jgi:hypothetical protein
VVDWQLVADSDARHDTDARDLRERIRVLEAQAMTCLCAVVMNRGASAARRSLAALESEIARLRAELAVAQRG